MSNALQRGLSRVLFFRKLSRGNFGRIYFYPICVDSHTIHYRNYQTQDTEDSRRAIGQHFCRVFQIMREIHPIDQ